MPSPASILSRQLKKHTQGSSEELKKEKKILIILRSQQTIKIYFWSCSLTLMLSRQAEVRFSHSRIFHLSGNFKNVFVATPSDIKQYQIHACIATQFAT